MKKMFIDDRLQTQFEADGYVVVPYLNTEEVARLKNLYQELHKDLTFNGFHSTSDNPDPAQRKAVDEAVRSVMEPASKAIFHECRTMHGDFLVKEPNSPSEIGVHQDWTFVDERKYASVSIWLALVDTNDENGALQVVKGSHRFTENLRGFPDFPSPYDGNYNEVRQFMTAEHVKAGTAIIYHHGLLHASQPNRTNETRLAAVMGMVPQEAQMYYYFQHNGVYEQFAVDPAFYLYYVKGARPDASALIGEIKPHFPKLTKREIYDLMAPPGTPFPEEAPAAFGEQPTGLLQKITNWLKTKF